jgi:hypothetical protein
MSELNSCFSVCGNTNVPGKKGGKAEVSTFLLKQCHMIIDFAIFGRREIGKVSFAAAVREYTDPCLLKKNSSREDFRGRRRTSKVLVCIQATFRVARNHGRASSLSVRSSTESEMQPMFVGVLHYWEKKEKVCGVGGRKTEVW